MAMPITWKKAPTKVAKVKPAAKAKPERKPVVFKSKVAAKRQFKLKHGWQPDVPDKRDHKFLAAARPAEAPLPASADLRSKMPAAYDQGDLGSCTANAIAAAIQFLLGKQGKKVFTPSRRFIYYNERVLEHTVFSDSGAQIRDGIKTVVKQGACKETTDPYNIRRFTVRPTTKAYAEALKTRAVSYARVARDLNLMKACLAQGDPFVIGFTVYDSFVSDEVAATGIVPMPGPSESVLGGHAVLVVGYDDSLYDGRGGFIVRNSWGPDWAQSGNFTLEYAYLLDDNLSDDFWHIKLVA